MPKSNAPTHRPFEVLKEMIDDGELELAPATDKLIAPPRRLKASLDDDEAFEQGMEDVRPLGWSDTPLNLPRPLEIRTSANGEAEALKELRSFVAGRGEMDLFAAGEGVEGASSREGRYYLNRLKRGDFSVQAHLDLHGFGVGEARGVLEQFLRRAQQRGSFCVRIVHGRGNHSRGERAVMKREVTRWLSSRRLSRTVIAFASARWKDGGGGAVYVLLYGKWEPPRR